MESLTQFIAPIVSLWVIHSAIFSSAEFVNKMRETVISGVYDGKKITPRHRRAIRIDWILCVLATVGVCAIFAFTVHKVAPAVLKDDLLQWVGIAIAGYPALCAAGFLVCSFFDLRLMNSAIAAADPPPAAAPPGDRAQTPATGAPPRSPSAA